ncbi:DNA repair protein rad18 [Cryptococcus amylolentus CBS 6039]|uniref:Postreplication repair E3 ubiquitin-protein ligase RAD18 n=1 Tax=Cryptococcus amylolentus CBS 6039 TaxID=1295533 RepID=A0A1E3HWV7_9TREE|nr:DNA repair protein rad18 [Cryptococcus amylolentus CBS 6039]ODN80808.1 DNA repair protein rad18 [Cryptococcus amylolentus CBS 6039]
MDKTNPWLTASDDPPPIPDTYPQLQRLDKSVVCQICKEPFQAPVSIACGHSFCSSCIRSSLDVQKKCPSCNEPASEGSIRRNRALEETADAWEDCRPKLIELTKPTMSRKRLASECPSNVKRLKDMSGKAVNGSTSPCETKRDSSEEVEVLELDESDEAPCPICQARLPIASIPTHIDKGCKIPKSKAGVGAIGNQKADWKKVFSGQSMKRDTSKGKDAKEVEMKRITKPNYSLSSPADLRSILSEYSLPTTGDKSALIARLQEWIVLFNANLDTSHPSSISALRAKLAEAEASRKKDKDRGKDELINQLGTKDGLVQYGIDKKAEFDKLRKDIMDRQKKSLRKGNGRDAPIELD